MINLTPRQKYLHLVARLYELAAEFTDDDLRAIRENFANNDEPGISKAIETLILLHGAQTSNRTIVKIAETTRPAAQSRAKTILHDALSDEALAELFGDESIFPHVQDIAQIIPGDFFPRLKESRSRYIRRAIKHITLLDDSKKNLFRGRLAQELEKKPNNFISQWKNLIREL